AAGSAWSWPPMRSRHVGAAVDGGPGGAVDVHRWVAGLPQGHPLERGLAGGGEAQVAAPEVFEQPGADRERRVVGARQRVVAGAVGDGGVATHFECRTGITVEEDAIADGELVAARASDCGRVELSTNGAVD